MDYFWSPNKAYGRKRRRKENKRKKGRDQIQAMDYMIFGMDFTWKARILWFCMYF